MNKKSLLAGVFNVTTTIALCAFCVVLLYIGVRVAVSVSSPAPTIQQTPKVEADETLPIAVIAGPATTRPGNLAILTTAGSVGSDFRWEVSPKEAAQYMLPITAADGRPAMIFSSVDALGPITFFLATAKSDKVATAVHVLTNGEPQPTPTPTPVPPNPPIPPTPPAAQPIQVVVIEETGDPSQGMAKLRNSKAVRDYCDQGGHHAFFLDIDSARKSSAWKTWADRATGKQLPYAFITPAEGGDTIKECSAPIPVADFLSLLQQYGGPAKSCPKCPEGVCPTK